MKKNNLEKTMPIDQLKEEYDKLVPSYSQLKNNLIEALTNFLKEANIPFFSVTGRIKQYDSFIAKIDLKKYVDPLHETEDLLGIRIIAFYPNDLTKIQTIINKEFDIISSENKEENLEINAFGYRSLHTIIKIKEDWIKTPNYRNAKNLKVEIQIRTILMHSWAEIEHKLQYKNNSQIPKELRRKLFRLSAKFEEADEQFQDIHDLINKYKNKIERIDNIQPYLQGEIELDLNTFNHYLEIQFPNYKNSKQGTRELFNEIIECDIDYSHIVNLAEKYKTIVEKVLNRYLDNKSSSANVLRYILDSFSEKFIPKNEYSSPRNNIIKKIKEEIRFN